MTPGEIENYLDEILKALDEIKHFKFPKLKRGSKLQLPGIMGEVFSLLETRKGMSRLVRLADALTVLAAAHDEIAAKELTSWNQTLAKQLFEMLPLADSILSPAALNFSFTAAGKAAHEIVKALERGDVWSLVFQLVKNTFAVATVTELAVKGKSYLTLRDELIDDLLSSTALLPQRSNTRHIRFKGSRKGV